MIALTGCVGRSRNNADILQRQQVPITEDTESSEITQIIEQNEQNNLIVNNNQDLEYLEQLAYQQINQYRQSINLPPLQINNSITQQSRIHSENMAQGKTAFSHDGFEQRVDVIGTAVPYRSAAENVAYNMGYADPVKSAVDGWLKSPGHYKNIVGDFNLTGVGVAKNAQGEYYFTQIFVLERNF
ncbi:MAG: CAP domain-containing protein [Cyanobacteria bacterium P01_F01_bin.143]